MGLALALLTFAAGASAQSGPVGDVVVNGRAVPACEGSAQGIDYACLNRDLKTAASSGRSATPASDAVTGEADVPSRVGTFSHTATAQRMGRNLGHSAAPYRPPPIVYSNGVPLGVPHAIPAKAPR